MGFAPGCAGGRGNHGPPWRIDLRRPATGEHTNIGMAADQHHGMKACGVQWQNIVLVFEQNNALFGEPLSHHISTLNIRNLLDHRVVKQAGSKNGAKDAMDVLIDFVL